MPNARPLSRCGECVLDALDLPPLLSRKHVGDNPLLPLDQQALVHAVRHGYDPEGIVLGMPHRDGPALEIYVLPLQVIQLAAAHARLHRNNS